MIKVSQIGALILSAGFSSRMGAFKPLLPLGDKCALERLMALYSHARVGEIIVVTGHRSQEIDVVVNDPDMRTVYNAHFEEGMFSSIKTGLAELSPRTKAFFVHPVDTPLVRPMTIKALVSAFQKEENDVVCPCFRGKRGHPPLIDFKLREAILRWDGAGGLRAFLTKLGLNSENLPVIDEYTLMGMNTWDEYEALGNRLKNHRIPSWEEAMALLCDVFQVDEQLMAHCETVADIANKIGDRFNQKGHELNLELLRASALLHDASKGSPHHGRRAADIIKQKGFPEVARLVERHMESLVDEQTAVDELDVLRLADRMVLGSEVVDIETRFDAKRRQCSSDIDAQTMIDKRLKDAMKLRNKIARAFGQDSIQFDSVWGG